MYCPNCGTQNVDNDKFCVKCGTALPSTQVQVTSPVKPQPAAITCHYHGCTEPVIGQCPGYKGGCLRFYCATHSIEPYCSICADKILRDAAIKAMYEDYLEAAKKIPNAPGCGSIIGVGFFVFVCSYGAAGSALELSNNDAITGIAFFATMAIGAIFISLLIRNANRTRRIMIAKVAAKKPGFEEFYKEYEKQKRSESMATVLTALLVAGAAADAIQTYQMRQDIHEIVKKMKS